MFEEIDRLTKAPKYMFWLAKIFGTHTNATAAGDGGDEFDIYRFRGRFYVFNKQKA